MNYENLTVEKEVLSADDKKIRLMLGSLKRVDAPKNFDFHLKARIANAKPTDLQPRFLPILRYVLPLSLVIVIFVVAVLNNLYFTDSQIVQPPQIAETRNQIPVIEQIENPAAVSQRQENPESAISSSNVIESNRNNSAKVSDANLQIVTDKTSKKVKPKVLSKENKTEDSGGSLISASTGTKIITPPGLNSNKTVEILPEFENNKSLNPKEILLQLGIEAAFTGKDWLVKSVKQYSLAERSGVKSGDAVEAIDGEKLTDQPLKGRKFEGKQLTVTRGTKKIEISLNLQSN